MRLQIKCSVLHQCSKLSICKASNLCTIRFFPSLLFLFFPLAFSLARSIEIRHSIRRLICKYLFTVFNDILLLYSERKKCAPHVTLHNFRISSFSINSYVYLWNVQHNCAQYYRMFSIFVMTNKFGFAFMHRELAEGMNGIEI